MKLGGHFPYPVSIGDEVPWSDRVERSWWRFWRPRFEVVKRRIRIDTVFADERGCVAYGVVIGDDE